MLLQHDGRWPVQSSTLIGGKDQTDDRLRYPSDAKHRHYRPTKPHDTPGTPKTSTSTSDTNTDQTDRQPTGPTRALVKENEMSASE